jgi:hypothetical protein
MATANNSLGTLLNEHDVVQIMGLVCSGGGFSASAERLTSRSAWRCASNHCSKSFKQETSGTRPEGDMAKGVIEYTKTRSGGTRLTVNEKALLWLVVLVIAIAAIVLGADLPSALKVLLRQIR